MRDEQDVDSNAMFWVLYPQEMKDPIFLSLKNKRYYIQPSFHYDLHQIAMRVETTERASTKKKKKLIPLCVYWKKKEEREMLITGIH